MSGQMRVDLSELEETVRKLKRVASAMSDAKGDGIYRTNLSEKALGNSRFAEASDLHRAHGTMKSHIEDIIDYLNEMLDDFGKKMQTTHGKMQDAEAEAKNGMSGRG